MVTLFNDKRGSYLIQESLFQKKCYNYFDEVQKKVSSSHSSRSNNNYSVSFSRSFINGVVFINGVEIPHYEEAQKITLRNFQEMNSEARQEVIKKFQLQSNIEAIGQEHFFQKLNEANEQVLELVNLVDLKLGIKTSKIEYAFLTDEEFKKLTLGQLEKASPDQIQLIFDRLKIVEKDAYSDVVEIEDILDLQIAHFHSLKAEKINEFIPKIPAFIFFFLSDTQINGLNFSQVSVEQLQNLFSCRSGTKEDQRRFAFLPIDQVNAILGKLNGYQMSLLSDDNLKQLNVSNLNKKQLYDLFSCRSGTQEDQRRFAFLPIDQVNAILGELNGYQMYLLSDDHLKQLNVSNLNEKQLQLLFSCRTGIKDDQRRFALLPIDQVNAILDKLNDYQANLVSNDCISSLMII